MSRPIYLVFSPLNHSPPDTYRILKTAQNRIQSSKLQMIKFIDQSRAYTCLQQRKFEYKWNNSKQKFESRRASSRQYLSFYQNSDGKKKQTQLKKVQNQMSRSGQHQLVKRYLTKDEDYDQAYRSCQELMGSYPIQLEGYSPGRMLSSFYQRQLYPQSQYHGYLNVCSTNHHSYFTGRKSFGYLLAHNGEVLMEKSLMVENLDDEQVWLKGLNFLLMDSFVNQIKRLFIRFNSRVLKNIWNDVIKSQKPQQFCKNQTNNSQQSDSTYEMTGKTIKSSPLSQHQPKKDQNQESSRKEVSNSQEEKSNDEKSVTESQTSQSESETSPQSQSQSQSQSEDDQSQSKENKTESESQSQQSQSEEKQSETKQSESEKKNDQKNVSPNTKQNNEVKNADKLTSWNPEYLKDVQLIDKKQELEFYNYKQNGYYKKDLELLSILVNKFDYVRLQWCQQKQNIATSQLAHGILNHYMAENKMKNKEKRLEEEQHKKEKKRLQEEEKKRKQDEQIKSRLMSKYRSSRWSY